MCSTRHCRGRRPRRPENQQTFVTPHGFACIFLTILKFKQAFLAPNGFIQRSKDWRAGYKARKPSETIFAPPFSTAPRLLSDKRPLLPISLYYPVSDPLIRSHPARSVSAISPKNPLFSLCFIPRGEKPSQTPKLGGNYAYPNRKLAFSALGFGLHQIRKTRYKCSPPLGLTPLPWLRTILI